MTTINIVNQPTGYAQLLEHARHGALVSPRGMRTREQMGVTVHMRDLDSPMPTGVHRGLHPAIGYAEAAQLIAGESHPDLMRAIAPTFEKFQNGGILAGAYGPRIREQLFHVNSKLWMDPSTRQAVAVIWDPRYDHTAGINDVPCTVELQFLIRQQRLHVFSSMRSNDVWWGLPYDLFQFAQLGLAVARAHDIEPGTLTHRVTSFHMYERDVEASRKVTTRVRKVDEADDLDGLEILEGSTTIPSSRWGSITSKFRRLLAGEDVPGLERYSEALRPFL